MPTRMNLDSILAPRCGAMDGHEQRRSEVRIVGGRQLEAAVGMRSHHAAILGDS